jgi:NAD(P)-dependent dehydrogenase (short-subunit alcohol dehydrogenase family)
LWWDFLPEEQRRAMFEATAASTPAGRVGRPDDVASAVLFMAGHEFLTGTVLPIAGGVHLPTGR